MHRANFVHDNDSSIKQTSICIWRYLMGILDFEAYSSFRHRYETIRKLLKSTGKPEKIIFTSIEALSDKYRPTIKARRKRMSEDIESVAKRIKLDEPIYIEVAASTSTDNTPAVPNNSDETDNDAGSSDSSVDKTLTDKYDIVLESLRKSGMRTPAKRHRPIQLYPPLGINIVLESLRKSGMRTPAKRHRPIQLYPPLGIILIFMLCYEGTMACNMNLFLTSNGKVCNEDVCKDVDMYSFSVSSGETICFSDPEGARLSLKISSAYYRSFSNDLPLSAEVQTTAPEDENSDTDFECKYIYKQITTGLKSM
ncbi:hypothetical protein RI129_003115 [Pyrocoelia pectoralis]|uniref:Uncharacterized protein n=1 Tax=Pyrocoelia pectoralis TaxID=417401 RepID=A0AAN7VQH9_9COLE